MSLHGVPRVESLTLTLEEALARLGKSDLRLLYVESISLWRVFDGDGVIADGQNWPEAVSAALGVPVVARDEAAELREENHTLRTEAYGWLKHVELLEAAIREWVEATSDAEMFELDQSNAYGTDHADAEHRVEATAQALRRLAGGGES